MTVLSLAAGIALIAVVAHDIFTVLFRPGAISRVSGKIARGVWTLLRRAGGQRRLVLSLAGPLALSAVIFFWATALVVGWGLIYLPHYPQEYMLAEGTAAHAPVVGALHISLTTITTLGSANVVAEPGWLQVLSPIEALIGFGMLTAAVSWLIQIHPVLSRRRALAYEIHLLADTERRLGVEVAQLEPAVASQLYADLTSRLVAVARDLVKFPITYYFAETDPRVALAAAMPVLDEIAERGRTDGNPDSVRLRAEMLHEAIEDFGHVVLDRFVLDRHDHVDDAIAGFAHDHRHDCDRPVLDEERAHGSRTPS